jgi:serine/threonine-protein kinase RsbT
MDRFPIRTEVDIAITIVAVQACARNLGFDQNKIDRIAISVSELTRNIIKYSRLRGGDLVVLQERRHDQLRLVLQARDNGPGIADLDAALQNHVSSSGSLGLGLPGVKRLADQFAIVSEPGEGTVVTVCFER